jgi:hypothetical protein
LTPAVETPPRARREHGFVGLILPLLLWVVTLAAIALIDVTAYLVAAARAQSLADAAALAAVSADTPPSTSGTPRGNAQTVVATGEGRLERCECVAGQGHASAVVSVPVPGLVLPRLGAARVTATADAVLAPPPDHPASPGRSLPMRRAPPSPPGPRGRRATGRVRGPAGGGRGGTDGRSSRPRPER